MVAIFGIFGLGRNPMSTAWLSVICLCVLACRCASLGGGSLSSGVGCSSQCLERMERAIRGQETQHFDAFRSIMAWIDGLRPKEQQIAGSFLGMQFVLWANAECADGPLLRFPQETKAAGVDSECSALVDLFEATDGPHWTNSVGWSNATLLRTQCCAAYGVICDESGHVTNVELLNNRLRGPIPPSVSALSSLDALELAHNMITSIPPEMGKLQNLTYLYDADTLCALPLLRRRNVRFVG